MLPPATAAPAAPPPVLVWYRLYAAAMAALYVLVVIGGVLMLVFREDIAATEPADSPYLWLVYGLALVAMGLLLAAGYIAAFFLPRKPWAWVFHLILIAIGLTSCCCMPVSIPLLIYWFKPPTQAWFGR